MAEEPEVNLTGKAAGGSWKEEGMQNYTGIWGSMGFWQLQKILLNINRAMLGWGEEWMT